MAVLRLAETQETRELRLWKRSDADSQWCCGRLDVRQSCPIRRRDVMHRYGRILAAVLLMLLPGMTSKIMIAALTHRVQVVLAWLLIAALVGCAPVLLYRHADRLVIWKVDDYFDLRSDQRNFLRVRLKELLAHHRQEALPVYERFLIDVKEKSADGISREELDWAFARFEDLKDDLFSRVIHDATGFLASVSEGQVRYLEDVFQKEQQRMEKALAVDTDKRLAKRAAATLGWLKQWLGPLTAEQKQRVRELSLGLPDFQRVRIEQQRQRQQKLVQLLKSDKEPGHVSEQLREWLLFPERSASPEYRQRLDEMRDRIKDMVLAIDRTLTPQQRAHAIRELQDMIADVHSMIVS